MRLFLLPMLIVVLLCGCAANREPLPPKQTEPGFTPKEESTPEQIDPQDWNRFYIAVFNAEAEVIREFLAQGFEIGKYQEELSESLYFEIYHSVQGFESRYLEGPLDPETKAYYDELEQSLISLCQRLRDLGFRPSNQGDLISAATFREFPSLIEWLEREF